jgi:Flp pilus assembly protein TadB
VIVTAHRRRVLRYVLAPLTFGLAIGVAAARLPTPWALVVLGVLWVTGIVAMIRLHVDTRRSVRALDEFIRRLDDNERNHP